MTLVRAPCRPPVAAPRSASWRTAAGGGARRLGRARAGAARVPLARGSPPLRRAACEEIIRHNARQNAVVGALPIPGAHLPVMTANHATLAPKLHTQRL